MYSVELYAAVRLAVVDEDLSHHEAARRFGIERRCSRRRVAAHVDKLGNYILALTEGV